MNSPLVPPYGIVTDEWRDSPVGSELDGHDASIVTFSDGTAVGYVVDENWLRPIREQVEVENILKFLSEGATMTIPETKESPALVLVIDDDITVANTVAMVLKTDGFEATVAYSGQTGVELARNREFDYLVTGVEMPQMNGIEAAIEICKLLPECRVVLVSGSNDSCALLEEALSRGYNFEILPKPVHPLTLFQTLRSVGTEQSSQEPN